MHALPRQGPDGETHRSPSHIYIGGCCRAGVGARWPAGGWSAPRARRGGRARPRAAGRGGARVRPCAAPPDHRHHRRHHRCVPPSTWPPKRVATPTGKVRLAPTRPPTNVPVSLRLGMFSAFADRAPRCRTCDVGVPRGVNGAATGQTGARRHICPRACRVATTGATERGTARRAAAAHVRASAPDQRASSTARPPVMRPRACCSTPRPQDRSRRHRPGRAPPVP